MKRLTKYPDRRLYDKHKKKFTNLQTLISYVRAGESVEVRCSKTGNNLTESVLLSAYLSLPESALVLNELLLYRLIRATGPGAYNRRLSERISSTLERLKTDIDDLDRFYSHFSNEIRDE